MEINAQEVINRLSTKLAKAEAEKTVMEVQIETLQEQVNELNARVPRDNEEGPVEGELIE